MNKLYTAVGCLHIDGRRTGKRIPIVRLNGQEYVLDLQEFMIWSILNWQILYIDQAKALYESKENLTGFYASRSFDDCVCRLLQRGLLAEGYGDTEKEALYRDFLFTIGTVSRFGPALFVMVENIVFLDSHLIDPALPVLGQRWRLFKVAVPQIGLFLVPLFQFLLSYF